MSKKLDVIADNIETLRKSIPVTSGNADVARLLAIARTHLETAELFVRKASNTDMLP